MGKTKQADGLTTQRGTSLQARIFFSLHVTYIQILLFFFICNFVIVAEKLLKQKTGKSFSHASLLLPSSIRTNSKKFSIEFKTSDAKTWPNKRVVYFLFRWKISKTTIYGPNHLVHWRQISVDINGGFAIRSCRNGTFHERKCSVMALVC